MNVSLYQAAAALNATARWQESIADNLAASGVPGYKRHEVVFSAFQAGLMAEAGGVAAANGPRFVMPQVQEYTSFRPGQMNPTDVKTDVAIENAGFFEVQLPNGTVAYTRDGRFTVDAQGQLVTKDGYRVLGESGSIQLDQRNPAPLSISPAGEVSQGADPKGKIKVVDFNNPQLLASMGAGYFASLHPDLQPTPVAEPKLRQGFVEAANNSAMLEMGKLITAMRLYEANQRVIHQEDERLGQAIRDLAGPN